MNVRDKVVIVTGASGGIGLVTARLLAQRGAKMALAARSVDKLEQLARELSGSFAVPTDMRDLAAVTRMIQAVRDHYGQIDVLVNNAGQGMRAPLEGIDLAEYQQIFELNVFGPVAAMQAVIPVMRSQGGGVIVNVSSMVSKMLIPNLAAYASTKYALNALTLTARAELAPDNIRVGVVYPRLTATDFGRNSLGIHWQRQPVGAQGTARLEAPTGMPEPDPAERVAEKILEAIESERAETYVGDEPSQG